MNKEEILNRYKQEAIDEGKNGINHYSDNKGFTAMCGLALLLVIYKIFNNQPFGDIMALLLIFLSVGAYHRYRKDNQSSYLYASLLNGLLCLLFLGWYIVSSLGI